MWGSYLSMWVSTYSFCFIDAPKTISEMHPMHSKKIVNDGESKREVDAI
jgi:hypothetical protein